MLPEYNKAKGMSDLIKSKMQNLKDYKKMASGGEVEGKVEEVDDFETVAAEMLLAMDKRDPKLLVKAFQAMFEMCEGMPHEEKEEEKEGPGALLISGQI